MTQTSSDLRTPGRAALGLESHLGRADLARRLQRFSLDAETLPRVLRVIEDEVAKAVASFAQDAFSASEIEDAAGAEALAKVRERRTELERVEAIRSAGLAGLGADELAAVLSDAKKGS